MDSDEKVKAIKKICEDILSDDSLIFLQCTCKLILKSILEVCSG